MSTWLPDHQDAPPKRPFGAGGWWRVIRRGAPMGVLVFGGLAVLLAVRLIERPLRGDARPWTPHITQTVCRSALWLLGLQRITKGTPDGQASAAVANHASWLDIFVLNAGQRIYFAAKSEVSGWPGIGWLARATGTLFIKRKRAEAKDHVAEFAQRLQVGHQLMFFPEGTSTDGRRVLPFKPTLFAAFLDPAIGQDLRIQPITLAYHAAVGEDTRQYGWWGDMDFAPHLLSTLAAKHHGQVHVIYHPAVAVRTAGDRKTLAAILEVAVRDGLIAEGVADDAA